MVFKNTLCTQQHHSHCRFCLCDSDLAYTVNLSPLHMNVSLLLQWCLLKLICSWQRISQSALEECGCFHTCLLCCSFMLKYKIQMYLSWKKFGTARPLPSVGQLTKLSNQGEHVFREQGPKGQVLQNFNHDPDRVGEKGEILCPDATEAELCDLNSEHLSQPDTPLYWGYYGTYI